MEHSVNLLVSRPHPQISRKQEKPLRVFSLLGKKRESGRDQGWESKRQIIPLQLFNSEGIMLNAIISSERFTCILTPEDHHLHTPCPTINEYIKSFAWITVKCHMMEILLLPLHLKSRSELCKNRALTKLRNRLKHPKMSNPPLVPQFMVTY